MPTDYETAIMEYVKYWKIVKHKNCNVKYVTLLYKKNGIFKHWMLMFDVASINCSRLYCIPM